MYIFMTGNVIFTGVMTYDLVTTFDLHKALILDQ